MKYFFKSRLLATFCTKSGVHFVRMNVGITLGLGLQNDISSLLWTLWKAIHLLMSFLLFGGKLVDPDPDPVVDYAGQDVTFTHRVYSWFLCFVFGSRSYC